MAHLSRCGNNNRHSTLVRTSLHGTLHIHSSHLCHSSARGCRDDFLRMARWAKLHGHAQNMWGGDMKLATDAADGIAPLQAQTEGDLRGPDADTSRRVCGHWVEVFQPLVTHRGKADGTWARLHRIYLSLPLGGWAGQATMCCGPLSDHCPVSTTWEPTSSPIVFLRRVPEWVFGDSSGNTMLAVAWAKLDTSDKDIWEMLGTWKELMHRCAAWVLWEAPDKDRRDRIERWARCRELRATVDRRMLLDVIRGPLHLFPC